MGMKWLIIIVMVLVAGSCGVEEIGSRPGLNRDDIWTGPGMNPDTDSREVCYVTAFDYPDDYDWRTDRERGSVKCSLVVFADGIPMMKVPVGEQYEVSSDPDMHWMLEGHLYTSCLTGDETVIKKDGRTAVRYRGDEILCGLQVDDDDIYTLGHFRQGKGFVYRRNGEIILERSAGRTFGRLQCDADSICFGFSEPIISNEETLERYYHVVNGKVSQEALRDDVRKVWDMVSYNGEVCYIASLTGVAKPVVFQGGEIKALLMPEDSSPLSFRMRPGEEFLCWDGLYSAEDVSVASAIWFRPDHCVSFPEGMVISSGCVSGKGICCAVNPPSSSSESGGIIYRSGEEFVMPEGYAVMGSSCAAVKGGMLHIGLSSQNGGQPMLWTDGQTEQLDINGYIASVSVF